MFLHPFIFQFALINHQSYHNLPLNTKVFSPSSGKISYGDNNSVYYTMIRTTECVQMGAAALRACARSRVWESVYEVVIASWHDTNMQPVV